jgi:tRNA (guanine-N7-)-methyltransferase
VKRRASLAPLIPWWEIGSGDLWQKPRGIAAPIEVEIGFGLGEILEPRARRFPERSFIGIEANWERTYRTLKKITVYDASGRPASALPNVHIFFCDARAAVKQFFVENSVSQVYSLFPCPWPKKAHAKHRLFQRPFLRLLNNRLVAGGTVQIVTDDRAYYDWVGAQAEDCGFNLERGVRPPGFRTKFEKKWQAQGQAEFFEILLTKIKHQTCPPVEDQQLKSFCLDHFDPATFAPGPGRSEGCTVVCKDVMYDPRKSAAVVLVLIDEDGLSQYFRVAVFRRGAHWRVAQCGGQTFLPTPGVNRAIEYVYESALAMTS